MRHILQDNIDRQIESNRGKNLFLEGERSALTFLHDTVANVDCIADLSYAEERVLIEYATDKALEEFCRINQYYSFDSKSKGELRSIYESLFSMIRKKEEPFDQISDKHYRSLKMWLKRTNSFSEKIYSQDKWVVEPVVCSEYSAAIQIEILKLDCQTLMEPILDIGCGKKGELVSYLRELGLEAYGFDRFSVKKQYIESGDWLDYDYGVRKWGTITSNLGFSNHFCHHNSRKDGDYIRYARKYMDILNSLEKGGCFHYAPDLPFIESYLNYEEYLPIKNDVGQYGYQSSIIKRVNI